MTFGDRLEEALVNVCSELKLFQNMVTELEKERKFLLDNLSNTVQAKEAIEKYAKQLELQIERQGNGQDKDYSVDTEKDRDPRSTETRGYKSPNPDREGTWTAQEPTSLSPSNSISRERSYDEASPRIRRGEVSSTEEVLPVRGDGVCAADMAGELQKGRGEVGSGLPHGPEETSKPQVRSDHYRYGDERRVVHGEETF